MIDIDSFGALFREQDAEGGKAELQVGQHAHVVDVQKVELQLFIGFGVILAVNLGVTRKTGFDLEAELEVRELLVILLRNLRPLGAGPDNRHVTLEDIHKLRELIQAALADNAPDGRDTGIIYAGGEKGNAVLLGIDAHGAELDDLELAAVLCQPGLLIEDGAAVIQLDRQGGKQHQRTEQNKRQPGADDVKDALDQHILRPEDRTADKQHRAVEGLDVYSLAHDNIPNMGEKEAGNALLLAVLQDAVADTAVDAGDKDGLEAGQFRFQLLKRGPGKPDFFLDSVKALGGLPMNAAQAHSVYVVPIDNDGPLGRIEAAIITVSIIREEDIQDQVERGKRKKKKRTVPLLPGDGRDQINQNQRKELRNELGENQRADAAVAEEIGIIEAVEEEEEKSIQGGNKIVIAVSVAAELQLPEPEQQPEHKKEPAGQDEMDSHYQGHGKLPLVFFFYSVLSLYIGFCMLHASQTTFI